MLPDCATYTPPQAGSAEQQRRLESSLANRPRCAVVISYSSWKKDAPEGGIGMHANQSKGILTSSSAVAERPCDCCVRQFWPKV